MRLLAGWVSTSCGQAEVVGAGEHLIVVIGSAWPLLPQPSSKTSCPLGSAVGHHLGVPSPVTAFTLPSAIPADSPETRGGPHLLMAPTPLLHLMEEPSWGCQAVRLVEGQPPPAQCPGPFCLSNASSGSSPAGRSRGACAVWWVRGLPCTGLRGEGPRGFLFNAML